MGILTYSAFDNILVAALQVMRTSFVDGRRIWDSLDFLTYNQAQDYFLAAITLPLVFLTNVFQSQFDTQSYFRFGLPVGSFSLLFAFLTPGKKHYVMEKTPAPDNAALLGSNSFASVTGVVDIEKDGSARSVCVVTEQSVDSYDVRDWKTTKNGIPLIPQPSSDPADPLNWSWRRKHKVLFALLLPSLLTDWSMTWGTTLFEAQSITWSMTVPAVAASVSGGIFLQGPGGVLAVPFVQRYGR